MNHVVILSLISSHCFTAAIELTFELPDNANQCFYEEVKQGTESTIEFQVVTGGQYDVDMQLKSLDDAKVLYKDIKKQYDIFTWTANKTGLFEVCFSCDTIHSKLKVVDDLQTHFRLRETTGRKRGEDLNDRVLWWSFGESCVVVIVGITQVLILRSFFAERRPGAGFA